MARTHPAAEEETRQVRVADPRLSPSANQRLTEEVQETLGTDEVRVPADRAHPSRGETPSGRPANHERPAATTVAQLSEAGVRDPERYFSALVEEFSPVPPHGEGNDNDRQVEAIDAPAQASAEQRGAITPTSGPSTPTKGGSAPDMVLWLTVATLAALSIVIPAVYGGGAMWVLTAIMLPLLAAWVVLQAILGRRDDASQ